jgi:hypothetical protein
MCLLPPDEKFACDHLLIILDYTLTKRQAKRAGVSVGVPFSGEVMYQCMGQVLTEREFRFFGLTPDTEIIIPQCGFRTTKATK